MNDPVDSPTTPPGARRWWVWSRSAFSFRNVSALYLLAVICIVFAFWVPGKFFTWQDCKTILENQATTGIAAVALVMPMSAGAVDLAVGAEVGIAVILVSWLLAIAGIPVALAIVLVLVVGGLIGLVSGVLITRFKIDSFIATIAMSSILAAGALWISSDEQIVGLSLGFQRIATLQFLGITLPVYILLIVSLVVWYVLEATPAGRRVYATGGNLDAARLAGVSTSVVIVLTLVACGVVAAIAGIVESASLGGGDPTVGPSYLIPALTAAFLGSTQFRKGRFNVWGTILAVYVLQAGVQGLELAGGPIWIPNLFDGVALAASVGLARLESRAETGAAIRRVLRFGGSSKGASGPDEASSTPVGAMPSANEGTSSGGAQG